LPVSLCLSNPNFRLTRASSGDPGPAIRSIGHRDPSGKRPNWNPPTGAVVRTVCTRSPTSSGSARGTVQADQGSWPMCWTGRRPSVCGLLPGAGRHGQVTLIWKWYLHSIIAHQDRLVRFGFQGFERFCAQHVTELNSNCRQNSSTRHQSKRPIADTPAARKDTPTIAASQNGSICISRRQADDRGCQAPLECAPQGRVVHGRACPGASCPRALKGRRGLSR
jgi:hypothetical protein